MNREYRAYQFICADACNYKGDLDRDLALCMFCCHFFFESETRLNEFCGNVASWLKPGGYFVGILVDSQWVLEKIGDKTHHASESGTYSISGGPVEEKFGAIYRFTLPPCVNDCPEYLSPFRWLKVACERNKLKLLETKSLQDWDTDTDLKYKMGATAALSEDETEVMRMYTTFVFQKM